MKTTTEQLSELVKTQGAQQVISLGLNMDCKKIITKSVLSFRDGEFNLRNCGVDIHCDNNDLADLFLDTKENRAELRKLIATPIIKSLQKEANAAPKYVLLIEGLGYLAAKQNQTGVIFTPELELAMQYTEGFDNPEIKLGIWNAQVKRTLGSDIKFEAVYL